MPTFQKIHRLDFCGAALFLRRADRYFPVESVDRLKVSESHQPNSHFEMTSAVPNGIACKNRIGNAKRQNSREFWQCAHSNGISYDNRSMR